MSYQKYRVREFGKDFNMKPQEVMELLSARFGAAPANQQAVLTADQLNYLFDFLIEKHQIESLALYFQAYVGKETYAEKQRRLKEEKAAKAEETRRKAEEAAAAEPPAPPAPSNEEVLLGEIRDLLKNKQ